MPVRMARSACSRVIAGSWAKLRVPAAIFLEIMPSQCSSSATPMSTGKTSAPQTRDRALTGSDALGKIAGNGGSDCLCGLRHALCHNTVVCTEDQDCLFRGGRFAVPVMPASCTTRSSSRPRLCRGLAIASQCCRAASIAAESVVRSAVTFLEAWEFPLSFNISFQLLFSL